MNDVLDYEITKEYRLKVRAVDVVTGDWSDTVVNIHVQDVNDEKPKFERLHYYASISEAVTVGSEVLTVVASDADQGINSQVYYRLKAYDDSSEDYTMFDVKVI